MFSYPFFSFPRRTYSPYHYGYKFYPNFNYSSDVNSKKDLNEKETETIELLNQNTDDENSVVFEIFGLKLHYDDILIICLLFFLYNEGVNDQYLFIALILLLLT